MSTISAAYITCRRNPRFDWMLDGLRLQPNRHIIKEIIVVDYFAQPDGDWTEGDVQRRRAELQSFAGLEFEGRVIHVPPMPNIWNGPHRVMKENWWGAATFRTTALCYAKCKWIAFMDDRSVVLPTWLESVERAMQGNYAVCGAYEKRHRLEVTKGVITHAGIVSGSDNRLPLANGKIIKANGSYWYGCTNALKLKWALQVGGYACDYSDGVSMEDILFGLVLENLGVEIRYDPSMFLTEDRTPSELDRPFRREDKGSSPNDKSHALLDVFRESKSSLNSFNLKVLREKIQRGEPFPLPTASTIDWYDKKDIREQEK